MIWFKSKAIFSYYNLPVLHARTRAGVTLEKELMIAIKGQKCLFFFGPLFLSPLKYLEGKDEEEEETISTQSLSSDTIKEGKKRGLRKSYFFVFKWLFVSIEREREKKIRFFFLIITQCS